MNINTNYQNISDSYLFSTINKKVREFAEANPDKKIIRLGPASEAGKYNRDIPR